MAQDHRGDLHTQLKSDGSIVTAADRDIERMLRVELPQLVDGSTVWGEEEGFEDEGKGGMWLVDPIDGTSNFAFGSPMWGVSVALVRDGVLLVGAVCLPDLHETFSGALGHGASLNGKMLAKIPHGKIRHEELVSFSDGLVRGYPTIVWPGKMRYSGAFVIDACWVAAGRLRGMVDYKCKLYDIAASVLICQELDADVRYANGDPMVIGDLVADRVVGRPFIIFPRDSEFFAS
jgi:myo-inositol-1(or 4)-monophosphatase